MPAFRLDIHIDDNATTVQIADAFIRLKRELEYILNGSLDGTNLTHSITIGDLTLTGGQKVGSVVVNDSTATTVNDLKNDYNNLLAVLRNSRIIG